MGETPLRRNAIISLLLIFALAACDAPAPPLDFTGPRAEWREYAGDAGGNHFSKLTQITRENVRHLELVWEHRSGDSAFDDPAEPATTLQATPLVVGDTLYYCTGWMRVFALDAETGSERWVFDPQLKNKNDGGRYPLTCRGLAWWEDAAVTAATATADTKVCTRRLLYGTRDSEFWALDADTGKPCLDFGKEGRVSLREGLGEIPEWEYYPTSPPVIVGNIAVLGALVADQMRVDAPSGVVRAFDVRSGERLWAWDPVPENFARNKKPGELYHRGTPNVWAPMSADPVRGLVFVPTGNPSPDSWAASRDGLDRFGSATVALNVHTGERVWDFQFVHHDVWDYDTASQPALFQHPQVAGGAPALVQATKMGHLYLLDRRSGTPLYPVLERAVPQDGAPEETLSPTQPFPTHPPSLHPTTLTPETVFGFTPYDRAACRKLLAANRWDGIYTPPTLQGSIQFPGNVGGMNWGGVAIDPASGVLIVNQTHTAMIARLLPRAEYEAKSRAPARYLFDYFPMKGTPYGLMRQPFFSPFGAPCNPPPWGTLSAVSLVSGEVRWRVPLGTLRDTAPFPVWALPWLRKTGTPNFGGGLLTASGVYFIGATTDRAFRAFDAESGKELWRARLPATANASPASYRLRERGRQFVVITAGGNPLTGMHDSLRAYALPAPR